MNNTQNKTKKIALVGEEVLQIPAQLVQSSEIGSKQLNQFIEDLMHTMLEANGIGIAAPQVFDQRAIMIVASKSNPRYPDAPDMPPLVLINPKIVNQSQQTCWHWEGCLSVPGLRGFIERSTAVTIEYQTQLGESQQVAFEGFVARIFLHEFDHLIGKTWLDHIQDPKHIMANEVWLEKFCT